MPVSATGGERVQHAMTVVVGVAAEDCNGMARQVFHRPTIVTLFPKRPGCKTRRCNLCARTAIGGEQP